MKQHLLKCVVIITCVIIPVIKLKAQDDKFKALFIYNFMKLVEWPNEKQEATYTITIYGSDGIAAEMENILKRSNAFSKPVLVKRVTNIAQISNTHILYVAKDKTSELSQISDNAKSKNILIIGDKANACSLGASLNFVSKNGNLNFEIHLKNIEKSGLTVSSELTRLGTVL